MEVNRKKLFVVGDRVLVTPEKGEGKTRVGLYLPATAVEKLAVQGGRIVEVGPGRVLTGMLRKIERRANAFSTDTLEGIEKFLEKDQVARSEA